MQLNTMKIIITGAATGMGRSFALAAVEAGAKVLACDVDEAGLASLAEESGGAVITTPCNVADEDSVKALFDTAESELGGANGLVNNAGIWRRGHVMETSSEQWDDIMDVNAKGVFLGTKAAIPEMRKAGGGSIVNISSTAGLVGSKTSAAYSASKGAVRIFSKSTAVQYASEGIRANSIHPGPIDTDMGDQVWPDATSREASISRTALARIGTANDIAYGALYLASDESSFVTGSELVIDGGVTAQ